MKIGLDDTIAAIVTPMGESGIGIVRLSGKDAIVVADKVFISKNDKKVADFKPYSMHYGWVSKNKQLPEGIIDEVLLAVMRAPKSFTKEDVVEINCHSGIVAVRAILELVLENGCRLAEPGEFTKRAFLNGRIDLTQAEAVLDIIRAKTDSALKIGVEQLKGALSEKLNEIREGLLEILALVEANIDFPEEGIDTADTGRIKAGLDAANNRMKSLLETSRYGRVMREGIRVVICGRPNVGKSSLLNALLKQERSIVTHIAGTTRDTIEEVIDIKGIPVQIVDTAGILEPRDLIERKAVLRSKKYIDSADLVIVLFDGSKKLAQNDKPLIKKLKKKTSIAVINKSDLKQKIEKEKILKEFKHVIVLSAKKLLNINLLEDAIVNLVYKGRVSDLSERVWISNMRHIEKLKNAQKLIAQTKDSLDNKLSLEFIAQDIKESLGWLDEILGRKFSEDLLDKIFSNFCIGK